ncbi:MAG: hypothetical protein LBL34_01310, partial [Clostridiales bacterium]|nr:hypothetical protein [Clostridiales bacterium]
MLKKLLTILVIFSLTLVSGISPALNLGSDSLFGINTVSAAINLEGKFFILIYDQMEASDFISLNYPDLDTSYRIIVENERYII